MAEIRTDKIWIRVTPIQKIEIEAEAAVLGISISEFMRNLFENYKLNKEYKK